jgi:hypothetical protein
MQKNRATEQRKRQKMQLSTKTAHVCSDELTLQQQKTQRCEQPHLLAFCCSCNRIFALASLAPNVPIHVPICAEADKDNNACKIASFDYSQFLLYARDVPTRQTSSSYIHRFSAKRYKLPIVAIRMSSTRWLMRKSVSAPGPETSTRSRMRSNVDWHHHTSTECVMIE